MTLDSLLLGALDLAVVYRLCLITARVGAGSESRARFLLALLAVGVLAWLSATLSLPATRSVLPILIVAWALAYTIVFQDQLGSRLERLGNRIHDAVRFIVLGHTTEYLAISTAGMIAEAATAMSELRQGALIVIERSNRLAAEEASGVKVDASLSSALLFGIFVYRSPLHDGAVLVRAGRIVAARAILPVYSGHSSQFLGFGFRHRAALGVTEKHDALAVVVSEETGQMSVVERARIIRVPTGAQLDRTLRSLLGADERPRYAWMGLKGIAAAPVDIIAGEVRRVRARLSPGPTQSRANAEAMENQETVARRHHEP